MPITNSFDLQIINEFIELRRMSEWLHNASESMAVPQSLAYNLDLCANEAVANIILYAYQNHEQHQIQMRIELKENQELCLTIQDDGMPFNPFEVLPPAPFDTIENAKIGGLGIQLIRSLMSECKYSRVNGNNIITLHASLLS